MLLDVLILRVNGLVEETIVYPSGDALGLLKLGYLCDKHNLSPYDHDSELTIEEAVDVVNELNETDGYEIIFSSNSEVDINAELKYVNLIDDDTEESFVIAVDSSTGIEFIERVIEDYFETEYDDRENESIQDELINKLGADIPTWDDEIRY